MRIATRPRSAIVTMYAGLAASVIAAVVPHIDHATADLLARHIRAGYPGYSPARIGSAAATYRIYLSVIGGLGALYWLAAIHTAGRGRGWALATATGGLGIGLTVGLFDLLVRDTSGETGLPPLLGWVGLAPCLAGLIAVGLLWRRA